MDDGFDFESDDITDLLSVEDLQRLENEAWKKVEVLENEGVENLETKTCLNVTKNERKNESSQSCLQMQQLTSELEKYKLQVQELQDSLRTKDGQLKIVRENLDACRKDVSEKDRTLAEVRTVHAEERSERNCKLSQEIKNLKTQLSFQKHELMKLETLKLQSQKAFNSQNVSDNCQNVFHSQTVSASQKVSGSVKRKASTLPSTSLGFDLDNSFDSTDISCAKLPQEKVPRIEKKNDRGKVDFKIPGRQSLDGKTNLTCKPSTSKINNSTSCKNSQCFVGKASTVVVEPNDKSSSQERHTNSCTCNHVLEPRFINLSDNKPCKLVKKLLLSYALDNSLNDESQDFETMSLLSLLKYPLKYLPDVLKAHSVDVNPDQSLSQFPIWQTQVHATASSATHLSTDEEVDFDSGKYNLVSQGIFLLLGLPSFTDKSVETLGVIHVLVFLELHITSYLLTRQRNDKHDSKDDDCSTSAAEEAEKISFDKQDIILQTLQILRLLFYSTPGLVQCVLNRTNPAFLKDDATDEDVIVVYDSNKARNKESLNANENPQEFEEDGVGSFRSLLLKNLLKLIALSDNNSSLLVCHASLEVLVAITAASTNTQLESMFIPLNCGCLVNLLANDQCTIFTVYRVMELLSNFLPCKDIHKMLCSHTDDCILLKIYQCACDEEDHDGEKFLQQFFQFLTKVAFSHGDSIEFLLESECQCSFEIVHCLVLVLYDKVKYLLDLETNCVVEDESLSLVRSGINILVILCTHTSYLSDHRLHVEHQFIELIYKAMILFKNIRPYMPELEALALQDLLDMENIDELEWSSGSENEDKD